MVRPAKWELSPSLCVKAQGKGPGYWVPRSMAVAMGEGHLAGLLPQAEGHTNPGDLAGKVLRK